MLNLNSIMLGSSNPTALIEFYKKVLGKNPDMEDGDWAGFSVGSCFLSISFHDQVKGSSTNPERILLNFETNEIQKEFERIKSLGTTVVKELYEPDLHNEKAMVATFADPDGNYFQLVTPWE